MVRSLHSGLSSANDKLFSLSDTRTRGYSAFIMNHSLSPAEANADTNREKIHPKGESISQQTAISCQRNEKLSTDTNSIYSDGVAVDGYKRCCSAASSVSVRDDQDQPDPALSYLAIIAELRAALCSSWLDEKPHKKADIHSDPAKRSSTSSSLRGEDHEHATRPETTSRSGLESTSVRESNAFRPVMHTPLHSQTNRKLKAARFQDTADNLAAPSLDASQAKRILPRKSRSFLSLRGPGRSRNSLAPVKKGWLRRVARVLTERGEQT